MNPSKMNKRFILSLTCVICTLALLVYIGLMPGADGSNMTEDTRSTYSVSIETHHVTNWHSSLFMYEGIAVKCIFALLGIKLSGVEVIRIMGICATFLSLSSIAYVLSLFNGSTKKYLCCYTLAMFIIFANDSYSLWGLDQFFTHVSITLIAVIVALYSTNSDKLKICLSILILILLWNCCAFRKNSILSAPLVISAIVLAFPKYRNWSYKKLIAAVGVLSMVFAIIFMPLVDVLFPVQQTKPITPMLISDVRIAAILEGEENKLFETNLIDSKWGDTDYTITAYWHLLRDKSLYPKLEKLYIQYWKEKPVTMMVAKGLQIFQFYYGGVIHHKLHKVVESSYPAVKNNPHAWKNVFSCNYTLSKIRWCTFILLAVTAVISYKQLKCTSISGSLFDFIYVIVAAYCLLYACSFIVVTPTPDIRYLAPSVSIGQLGLMFWLGRLLNAGYHSYYQERTK